MQTPRLRAEADRITPALRRDAVSSHPIVTPRRTRSHHHRCPLCPKPGKGGGAWISNPFLFALRLGRRLVAADTSSRAQKARPPTVALGERDSHTRGSLPVAPMAQRKGFLQICRRPPARILPESTELRPAQGSRICALEPEIRALQSDLARTLAEPQEVYQLLDTTLIPAVVRVRADP
jgi:hypothetical protein